MLLLSDRRLIDTVMGARRVVCVQDRRYSGYDVASGVPGWRANGVFVLVSNVLFYYDDEAYDLHSLQKSEGADSQARENQRRRLLQVSCQSRFSGGCLRE